MNTNEQTRELVTEARQHEEQLHDNVHNRAVESLTATNDGIQDETRKLAIEGRLHDENLHQNVLNRAADELKS